MSNVHRIASSGREVRRPDDLAGLPLPEGLEGTSFAPLLDEPERVWKSAVFHQVEIPRQAHSGPMGRSIRTDRFRYTEWGSPGRVLARELYDHERDPGESANIANLPENAALVARLSAQLARGWRGALPPHGTVFLRGDCNDDGEVDFSDAIFSLGSLFLGEGDPSCDDACDSNDDGAVDISDAINTLGVLFLGNGVIPLPGMMECGIDPTEDQAGELGCENYESCQDG